MTWFRKNGQVVRKFKDEFIDSMISHASFFPIRKKRRRKNRKSRRVVQFIHPHIQNATGRNGLTSLPISEEDDEGDEHFIEPGNTVYGTVSDRHVTKRRHTMGVIHL